MFSERELITELQKGSADAVDQLLERYGDRLLRVALGICGDRQRAEEAVQDAMLQAIRKIHSFHGHAALNTWLYRITVNQAKNRRRGFLFKGDLAWNDKTIASLPGREAEQPEAVLLREEARNQVLRCLQALPENYRIVLTLYYLEEFSIEDIARILGNPAGTVKSRMSRGRALLKAIMYKEGGAYCDGPV